jgi:nucleoside-diphosphate-sugar epimerase
VRVLVTGHQGYIGSVLAPRLVNAGHDVVGLDVGFFADCLVDDYSDPGLGMRIDLRDVSPEHCEGFDAVVHLGALCNDPLGNLNADLTRAVNHRSTVELARAAKRAGVARFLFSSSCSLYGAGNDTELLDESAGFAPVTPYGESKIRSEQDLVGLADDAFSPVFLRNATAYGFSPRLRGDLVVNDLVGHALLTGEVKLRSDGMAWRPLVHVDDIASAFVALLEAPRDVVHAKAYNIGQSDENYLIRDVAELVARHVPGSTVTFAAGVGADARNYRVSCDRVAAEVPAFKPQWTVADGIDQLVDAYRRTGLTIEHLTGERCQRLGRIRSLLGAGRVDDDLRWTVVAA